MVFTDILYRTFAGVAELADALDLGSSAARRGGSTPLVRTITAEYLKNDDKEEYRQEQL